MDWRTRLFRRLHVPSRMRLPSPLPRLPQHVPRLGGLTSCCGPPFLLFILLFLRMVTGPSRLHLPYPPEWLMDWHAHLFRRLHVPSRMRFPSPLLRLPQHVPRLGRLTSCCGPTLLRFILIFCRPRSPQQVPRPGGHCSPFRRQHGHSRVSSLAVPQLVPRGCLLLCRLLLLYPLELRPW